jgi:hypothetical protein
MTYHKPPPKVLEAWETLYRNMGIDMAYWDVLYKRITATGKWEPQE